jgi:hypothetical protein
VSHRVCLDGATCNKFEKPMFNAVEISYKIFITLILIPGI